MTRSLRRYHTHNSFDSEKVELWDEELTKAMNFVSNGKVTPPYSAYTDEYGLIFEIGVERIRQVMADEGDEETRKSIAISKKLRKARAKDAKVAEMVELYERNGLDDFVTWCEEEGIDDWQEFLEKDYTLFKEQQKLSWSEQAREWLGDLLSNGDPVPVNGVRVSAQIASIIDCSSEETAKRDWGKLSVLAHREGYTGMEHRGHWKRKPKF